MMKIIKTAVIAATVLSVTTAVHGEGSAGDADIQMDFNRDGVTDTADWSAMKEWVSSYQMKEGEDITNYGGQEAPASINLLIDRDYAAAPSSFEGIDVSSASQYYLPSLGDTTPVKDQSPFGTCWAFGTMSSLESNLLHKRHGNSGILNPDGFTLATNNVSKDMDLSELYLAYMNQTPVASGPQTGEGNMPTNQDEINAKVSHGGFASSSQSILTAWIGPLAESQEPYLPKAADSDGSNIYGLINEETDMNCPAIAHVQEFIYLDSPAAYHIDTDQKKYVYDSFLKENVTAVKQAVVKYGAVMMCYRADSSMPGETGNGSYMNYDEYCQYDDSLETAMNHMVSIVGWNDDYSRENFKTEKGGLPENNGAWLIKNSWGSYDLNYERFGERYAKAIEDAQGTQIGRIIESAMNYGIKDENGHGSGYCWVSYEDHTILDLIALDADDSADGFTYDYIYQYDYTNPVSFRPISLPTGNDDTWTANIFTSQRNETLSAVSVYAPENGTTAQIEVYRLAGDSNDLSAGEKVASASAELNNRGFHTVALEESVALAEGDRFAVAEKVTTEKDGVKTSWLNLEQTIRKDLQTKDNINDTISTVVANKGETLVHVYNGTEYVWSDAKELDSSAAASVMSFGNAYIKAYTVTEDKAPLPDADTNFQGGGPGDEKNFNAMVTYINIEKYALYGVIAIVVILILIIILIVRAFKKRKKRKIAKKAARMN